MSHSKIVDCVEHHEETNELKDALWIRAGEAIGSFIRGKASLTRDDIDEIEKGTDTAGIHIVGVLAYLDQLGTDPIESASTVRWGRLFQAEDSGIMLLLPGESKG